MIDPQKVLQQIKQQGVLPLFYQQDVQACMAITQALYNAGIRCIEFTNRGPAALKNFEQLVTLRDTALPGLLLGIGTIKSANEAIAFIAARADFLVSPYFDEGVCTTAKQHNKLWIPGCTTPTEIHTAQLAGCNFVKIFPGSLLQPAYTKAVLPLFNELACMVTGGVEATEQSLKAWFDSGVAVVGIGGHLVSDAIVMNKQYEVLSKQAADLLAMVQAAKKN
ncbi:MAG: hypothetical protein RL172_1313 [Bacteroidota bacterium]|jgi:2-dehydro-3-deoxyphosphogluconate aldolase / (4S)-4-hydroxy-2-oxoglutarate aldolase